MSYTRYNFIDWNNLTSDDLDNMQNNVKQVIKDFLGNLLNIGFGRGGWKNITFSQNGTNAVNVVYNQWAFLVQNHMLATPAQGTVSVTGFANTSSGQRTDVIAARVYEFEDRTKLPYQITQEIELKRVEAASIDQFGYVYIGNIGYLALARVVVGDAGIVSITPYRNEPRIDTRNVDGTILQNGDRENLWDALKRLENMINSINVGGGGDPGEPVDLSPYVQKKSFGMLTGTKGSGTTITWDIQGMFPRHTPMIIGCEVSQIRVSNNVNYRVYRPHKDYFSSSYIETWENPNKTDVSDEQAEKIIFNMNGSTTNQGVYVRVFLLIEDGIYVLTTSSSVPTNLREVWNT